MERIKDALIYVFEDFDEGMFNADMKLGDITDWDSMNSVNLQMELESIFDVDLSDTILMEKHKISDVIDILRSAGANI